MAAKYFSCKRFARRVAGAPSIAFRTCTLALVLLVPVMACAADEAVLAAGRALSEQFERGDTSAVYARMTPSLQKSVGGADGLAAFRAQVLRDAGPETGIVREETRVDARNRVYRRIARRNVGAPTVLMEWTLDPDDRIAGFVVRTEPTAIPSS
jgi:hypothetical protein